jgi:hypothetical protein
MSTFLGVLVVTAGGFIGGSGAWPFKLMRRFQFEHWFFVGSFFGLIVLPWIVTLAGCPHAVQSIGKIPVSALIKSNLFSFGWGIAAVLCSLCYVRIGVALTGAILAGLGASLSAVMPMIFKGSGLFRDAPEIGSPAGLSVLVGVAIMLVGVILASVAGYGRDRELKRLQQPSGSFSGGLIMTIIAGILSAFMPFAFVYGQGPIVANLSAVESSSVVRVTVEGAMQLSGSYTVDENRTIAMKELGPVVLDGFNASDAAASIQRRIREAKPEQDIRVVVETGSVPATFGVFALGLFSGAMVCIVYAAYLLLKNRSWGVFLQDKWDMGGGLMLGVNTCLAFALMGKGMLLLGALGASTGSGVYMATQLSGSQFLGFVSGEWRGVYGKSRVQMYMAIGFLMAAVVAMSYANTLSKS